MQYKVPQTAAISRRSLGRVMLGSLLAGLYSRRARAANTPLLEVDRFVEGLTGPFARRLACSYRADAVIVLFSVPVYRRTEVGSGSASLAEAAHEDGRYLSLRFIGASCPERAAGLDRVGSMREVVMERGAALSEAAYFGVLTSSPEETLEEGKRSLGKTAEKWNEYTAIDGHTSAGLTRSAVTHFRLSSASEPNMRIIEEARANFKANRPAWRESQWRGENPGHVPPTFLYALIRAIRQPKRSVDTWYVYSERSFRLRLEKEWDRHEGLRFAQLGLTSRPASVLEVRGRIREDGSGRQTTFRLWIEDGPESTLPLRIEFQPRPYLRLSFEVDPKASTPTLEENP